MSPQPTLLVYLATNYGSRFDLLGTMAGELAQALRGAGAAVWTGDRTPCLDSPPVGAAMRLFFNHPPSIDALRSLGHRADLLDIGLVQFFVDHPLALDAGTMDALAAMPNFRSLLVSTDDASLLRLRWPGLMFGHCLHGVPESALVDVASVEHTQRNGRDIDVVAAGGIHSPDELESLWGRVPAALRASGRAIVDLMVGEHLSFTDACDVALPAFLRASDAWKLLQIMHRACVAAANRHRRAAMIGALRGLSNGDGGRARVVVAGPPAWQEFCGGAVQYLGEIPYASLSGLFSRARVCLAWGPTQFSTAFSERLLLGMAAGCACVAEDRLMVRAHFAGTVSRFPENNTAAMSEAVRALLADAPSRCQAGTQGVHAISARHLWRHRLATVLSAGTDTTRMTGSAA